MPVKFRKPRKAINATTIATGHGVHRTTTRPAGRIMAPSRRGFRPRSIPKYNPSPLLSILIPTIPGREEKLANLLSAIDSQIDDRSDVELLVLRDSRGMTIGEKRNRMIALARGAYVTFVDDDDDVAGDYVAKIVDRIVREKPDVICYLLIVEGHGHRRLCRYHPSLKHENLPNEYHRKPNHLMVWRRELALREPFPAIQTGEDTLWADAMAKHIIKVSVIDDVLYTYRFDPKDNSAVNAGG